MDDRRKSIGSSKGGPKNHAEPPQSGRRSGAGKRYGRSQQPKQQENTQDHGPQSGAASDGLRQAAEHASTHASRDDPAQLELAFVFGRKESAPDIQVRDVVVVTDRPAGATEVETDQSEVSPAPEPLKADAADPVSNIPNKPQEESEANNDSAEALAVAEAIGPSLSTQAREDGSARWVTPPLGVGAEPAETAADTVNPLPIEPEDRTDETPINQTPPSVCAELESLSRRLKSTEEELCHERITLSQTQIELEAAHTGLGELQPVLAAYKAEAERVNELLLAERLEHEQELQRARQEHEAALNKQMLRSVTTFARLLPDLSVLAGREPGAVVGLEPAMVLDDVRETLRTLCGARSQPEQFPRPETLTDGCIRLNLDDEESGVLRLLSLYDWTPNTPFESGVKQRWFKVMRHGWQIKRDGRNLVLVKAKLRAVDPPMIIQLRPIEEQG